MNDTGDDKANDRREAPDLGKDLLHVVLQIVIFRQRLFDLLRVARDHERDVVQVVSDSTGGIHHLTNRLAALLLEPANCLPPTAYFVTTRAPRCLRRG